MSDITPQQTLQLSVNCTLPNEPAARDLADRLTQILNGMPEVHSVRRCIGPQVELPDTCWEQSDAEHGDTRLFTTVYINGQPFHAEAWPVKQDNDLEEIDGLYPDDLDSLRNIYDPSGRYNTLRIQNRDCIVILYPFG